MAVFLIHMAGWSDLSELRAARAIVLGAVILMWPAFWNGYPILYSDTNAFMVQGILNFFVWDKPFIYGPWMSLFHWQYSLWPVLFAQALMVSSILWLTMLSVNVCALSFLRSERSQHGQSDQTQLKQVDIRFVVVCLLLAAVTAAPWFISLLMPDIFAPITVLCIYILTVRPDLDWKTRFWVLLVGTFAIASHLSHLVIAAAVLPVVACIKFGRLKVAVLPLVLALGTLVATNLYGFQKLAISPFGSVFLLARLEADGHIKPILDQACVSQPLYLCGWKDRLAPDSDDFLWDGKGPVWIHPGGPIGLAPEASELVRSAVIANPLGVVQSLVKNTWTELWMIGLGDTLHPDHLDLSVRARLETYFPQAELNRYWQSRQVKGTLTQSAGLFNTLGWVSLLAGLVACVYAGIGALMRGERTISLLIGMVFVALLANAFATGALSKPHYRYQTRIAWLVVFVPLILPFRARGTFSLSKKANHSG